MKLKSKIKPSKEYLQREDKTAVIQVTVLKTHRKQFQIIYYESMEQQSFRFFLLVTSLTLKVPKKQFKFIIARYFELNHSHVSISTVLTVDLHLLTSYDRKRWKTLFLGKKMEKMFYVKL